METQYWLNVSPYVPGGTVLSASQLKLLLCFSSLIFVKRICWRAAAVLDSMDIYSEATC